METNNFRKLSSKELDQTYGGWQWLVALVPLVIQAVTTAIVTIKTSNSNKGSIKTKDFDAKWDLTPAKTNIASQKPTQIIFYAY